MFVRNSLTCHGHSETEGKELKILGQLDRKETSLSTPEDDGEMLGMFIGNGDTIEWYVSHAMNSCT